MAMLFSWRRQSTEAQTTHDWPSTPQLRRRTIYHQQHKHSASREVIAQALGYTTFNGASKAVITALKHYGLLEPTGNGLRIPADAIRMLEFAEGDPERTAALVRLEQASTMMLPQPFFGRCENGGNEWGSRDGTGRSMAR
jgi:hypothetical protein